MTVLVRDKPGSNFMPAAAVVSGGGVMSGPGLSGSGEEPDPVAVELARLSAENRVLRAALLEIAHRTMQAPLNRLAHQALGHESNPHTTQLLAEITHDRRQRR